MPDPAAFFDMGGYAAFVWPAYGISFLVLTTLVAATIFRRRRILAQLQALERAQGDDAA